MEKKHRAILIDDEQNCTEILVLQLEKYCQDIEIISVANDPRIGIEEIQKHRPDVVFLDIEMPELTGFDVLEKTQELGFEVIFTTAHQDYAIRAIRFSALDYLMKPVESEELIRAVRRLKDKKDKQQLKMQLDLLFAQMSKPNQVLERIALATSEGMEVVDVKEILYCEAQSNYTTLHFLNRKKLMVSKTLKQIESLLADHLFFRVHQSYLVNLHYVKKFVRSGGGYLIMEGETTVNVANSRREGLMRRLTGKK